MRSLTARVLAFVAAVVFVGVVTAGAGFVFADGPSHGPDATVEKSYYTDESLIENAALSEASGDVDVRSTGQSTVLIKHAGSNDRIEPLTRALVSAGHEVQFVGGGQAGPGGLNVTLSEADAFVAIGAGGYGPGEINGIEAFADAGGRVLIAHDATAGGAGPALPGLVAPSAGGGAGADALTSRFGVSVGSGYLYNMFENDANHQRVFAQAGASGSLGEGVDEIVLDTPSPLYAGSATAVVETGERTHYSVSRDGGPYAVGVQSGDVVVLGDTAIFEPLNYNRADNDRFLGNVMTFLTSGDKVPSDAPMDEEAGLGSPGQPPRQPPEQPPQQPPGEEPPRPPQEG